MINRVPAPDFPSQCKSLEMTHVPLKKTNPEIIIDSQEAAEIIH